MIHESAIVHQAANIGENTQIWHWTHVREGAVIGNDCVIGQNVYVASNVVIGNGCKVQNNVSVYDNVTLEDDVFCGPSMVFTNVKHPRAHISRKDEFQPTVVRRGATLGANCTIVCGVEIGPYAFIGAGTVVVRDVPAFALMVGNPAKQKGWVCQCGERLPDANQMECDRCGSQYVLDAGKLTWVVDAP